MATGRTNCRGVSVLYVTYETETAVTENQPNPGHYISI